MARWSDERFGVNTPTVSHETIDHETLIINLESGTYYSLLGVGVDIWSLMDRGAPAGAIVNTLHEHYDRPLDEITSAVTTFLAELQRENLIVSRPADEAPDPPVDLTLEGASDRRERPFAPPVLNKHTDIKDLLLLCPVHDVDENAWPEPNLQTAD